MFEHSVKVPRHYKVASNILKKVSTEGGSVKSLLYDVKLRHFRTNVLFALITETIKHAAEIDKMFECCELFVKETRLDPWLAKILTAELLFGKKSLPGKSKPEQTIVSYKEQFQRYLSEHQDEVKPEVKFKPRYVRINTNLLTTSDAIRSFQDEGYRFIRCTSGSYNDYLEQIQNLSEYDFTQDYHVKTVFVFASGTKLHEHELYVENKIILQNKATALAVHLLAPPPGSVIMDMCAAPGMKTTQLAAYMRNECKIYAVERNEKRYGTLCDFVTKTGSNCVQTIHKDCLEIKRGDYDDVEYIILDPSCSGSGMEISVHNYIDPSRLAKLTSLQEKFLKHAMNAFPKVKRIVYSTCSIFPEENERVITNVVRTSRTKWRVQDVKSLLKGQWNNFGSAMYGTMGTKCLYAKPESDFTTGFFLAVLDRDEKQLEKQMNKESGTIAEEVISKKKSKGISNEIDQEMANNDVEMNVEAQIDSVKTKSKKKKNKRKPESEEIDNTENMEEIENPKKKKRKDVEILVDNLNGLEIEQTESSKVKKKKRDSELGQENCDNGITEEITKKNKKRKKDHDVNLTDGQEAGDEPMHTKVKSKKHNESIKNMDCADVDISVKKKKKKKKHEEHVE